MPVNTDSLSAALPDLHNALHAAALGRSDQVTAKVISGLDLDNIGIWGGSKRVQLSASKAALGSKTA